MRTPPTTDPNEPALLLRSAARRIVIIAAAACAYVALFAAPGLARHYFETQDIYVAAAYTFVLAAFSLGYHPLLPRRDALQLDLRRVLAAAILLTLLLWLGTYVVLDNYPLTRDEHMVVFDAAIYRSGRLAAEVPVEWRPFVFAMAPAFLLDVPENIAWVSAYFPGNAALRAGFSLILDAALMNPMLAGIGAVALYIVARRLFPDQPSAQLVALLLYFTSAQMAAAAMTTYAMTGHMALSLVWLALFLRGDRLGHCGAVLVGFVATGLHQIIFHPLFVLPFIDHLRRRGEWRAALFYVAAYAAIGLVWMSYPGFVLRSIGAAAELGAAGGGGYVDYLQDRVLPLLQDQSSTSFLLMTLNLLRFFSWQNLALVPLVLAALPLARRGNGIAGPLYGGVLLTVLAVFILLPSQGHGWGYRYLHGLLGSLALLGAYGWERLSARKEPATELLALGTAMTMLTAAPFLLWKAHRFSEPYAAVDTMIGRIDADFVVIDTDHPAFAIDQVRNDPDLRQRPLRFSSAHLDVERLDELCRRGSVAFVDRKAMERLGLGVGVPFAEGAFGRLRARLQRAGCLAGR